MANSTAGEAMPAPMKMDPTAHISWPGPEETDKKIKLSGDVGALGLGKTARIVIEGKVTGFSMGKYGCSLDLHTKAITVDHVSEAAEEESGKSLVDMVESIQEHKKK